MTKVIVLGGNNKETKKKPIEFIKILRCDGTLEPSAFSPNYFSFIELIVRGYNSCDLDLMFAYDSEKDRESGLLYLGHFNDGVVE